MKMDSIFHDRRGFFRSLVDLCSGSLFHVAVPASKTADCCVVGRRRFKANPGEAELRSSRAFSSLRLLNSEALLEASSVG